MKCTLAEKTMKIGFSTVFSNGDNTITLTEPDGDVVVSVMEKV